MSDTDDKTFGCGSAELAEYVKRVFRMSDPALDEIEKRAAQGGLPPIHVSHAEGRHLELIARAAGARKIVEIGTLAGLSGVCLARALPKDGVMHTFEYNPERAKVAAESFRRAKLDKLVTIHVGPALDNLPAIENEGPFDLVFIDADKPAYPAYLDWAARNLRIGGVVLADNAFAGGDVARDDANLAPERRERRDALLAFNRALADPAGPFRATMIPTGEGLAMGVRIR